MSLTEILITGNLVQGKRLVVVEPIDFFMVIAPPPPS